MKRVHSLNVHHALAPADTIQKPLGWSSQVRERSGAVRFRAGGKGVFYLTVHARIDGKNHYSSVRSHQVVRFEEKNTFCTWAPHGHAASASHSSLRAATL